MSTYMRTNRPMRTHMVGTMGYGNVMVNWSTRTASIHYIYSAGRSNDAKEQDHDDTEQVE
jgi:hypothetical protein